MACSRFSPSPHPLSSFPVKLSLERSALLLAHACSRQEAIKEMPCPLAPQTSQARSKSWSCCCKTQRPGILYACRTYGQHVPYIHRGTLKTWVQLCTEMQQTRSTRTGGLCFETQLSLLGTIWQPKNHQYGSASDSRALVVCCPQSTQHASKKMHLSRGGCTGAAQYWAGRAWPALVLNDFWFYGTADDAAAATHAQLSHNSSAEQEMLSEQGMLSCCIHQKMTYTPSCSSCPPPVQTSTSATRQPCKKTRGDCAT